MPSIIHAYSSSHSNTSSSHDSKSRQSSVLDGVTFSSQSTTPTSVAAPESPRLIDGKPPSYREAVPSPYPSPYGHPSDEDLSPSTKCYPRLSVETYVSATESQEDLEQPPECELYDDDDDSLEDSEIAAHDSLRHGHERHSAYDEYIPRLPEYCHDIVDDSVRPSSPQEFSQLFPSLNRMAIRHDEFTTDGNMNLRVDITVPGTAAGSSHRRRPTTYQLFHLRMYDLSKREFSLRRYCRDSGREVCSAKRLYIDPAEKHRPIRLGRSRRGSHGSHDSHGSHSSHNMSPALQRSMSMALKSLGAMAKKSKPASFSSSSSSSRRPVTSHSPYGNPGDAAPSASSRSMALSSRSMPSFFGRGAGSKEARALAPPPSPKPTNTIKLEFSNYARVDVKRRGSPSSSGDADNVRYAFGWWGHKYVWKRIAEKHLDVVSYHLLRDGDGDAPVAHIVPEMRAPNEVRADDAAGGWIPPCHMWITDPSVLEAMTDVADVIVATGLMALVDDCIRMRWAPRRAEPQHHLWTPAPLAARTLQQVFHRRHTGSHAGGYTSSPLRQAQPISTY